VIGRCTLLLPVVVNTWCSMDFVFSEAVLAIVWSMHILKAVLKRAVIPKSTSPSHLRSNLDVVDWELPQSDYDTLCKLPYQVRHGVVTYTYLYIGRIGRNRRVEQARM